MTLPLTLAILAASVAIYAYGSWRAAQPADPLRPRLLPWRPIILTAGVVGLLMLVHLANLFGMTTGDGQLGGRRLP